MVCATFRNPKKNHNKPGRGKQEGMVILSAPHTAGNRKWCVRMCALFLLHGNPGEIPEDCLNTRMFLLLQAPAGSGAQVHPFKFHNTVHQRFSNFAIRCHNCQHTPSCFCPSTSHTTLSVEALSPNSCGISAGRSRHIRGP